MSDVSFHTNHRLHLAAMNKDNIGMMSALRAGANKDFPFLKGDSFKIDSLTALHSSARNGYEEGVLMLLAAGAKVDVTNNLDRTPLIEAIENGHDKIVVYLLEAGADLKRKSRSGRTAMHHASQKGHNSIINILVQHGADINAQDKRGTHPIHYAAMNGHNNAVSTLIELGAEINCLTTDNETPLHFASQEGHEDVVHTLLRNHADTDIMNNGQLASHQAAIEGKFNVLKKLIENGSDIDAVTEDNHETLLWCAVINDHEDIVKWLVLEGANPYISDLDGNSPIHLALNEGNRKLAAFMASRNKYLSSSNGSTSTTSTEATNLECAICLGHRTETIMTEPCHHAKTCKRCMDAMEASGDNRCPVCRTQITKRTLIYL